MINLIIKIYFLNMNNNIKDNKDDTKDNNNENNTENDKNKNIIQENESQLKNKNNTKK